MLHFTKHNSLKHEEYSPWDFAGGQEYIMFSQSTF